MAKKRFIEIACTGNRGRSPIAELIARNRLAKIGAFTEYDSISSGTLVDVLNSGSFPIKAMNPIIEVAKDRGDVYDLQQLEKLDIALREGDTETVKQYFDVAAELFKGEEKDERDIVLRELGIKGRLKLTSDQTIVRPDVVALFAMDDGNYQRAQEIYNQSDYNPLIDNLDVENAFGLGIDAYRNRIKQLLEKVPKAVDKVVGA